MKTRYFVIGFLLLAFTSNVKAQAQNSEDAMSPQKYENVTWYSMASFRVDDQKMDSAMTAVEEYFVPALKHSGLDAEAYFHMTGEWSFTIMIEMQDGPSWLEWKIQPTSQELIKYLVGKEGGMEAMAMLQRVTLNSERQVVMKYNK